MSDAADPEQAADPLAGGAPTRLLVNIDVYELDAAARFYRAAFGLTVGRRFGAAAVELLGASAPISIYLLAKAAGTAASPHRAEQRRYARHWTPVHLDIVVADIESSVRDTLAAGAMLEQQVAAHAGGVSRCWPTRSAMVSASSSFIGRGYDETATAGGA